MKNKRQKQTNFVYIYKVSKFFAKNIKKNLQSCFFVVPLYQRNKKQCTMLTFIKSRKIKKQAQNIYREMWEKGLAVTVTSEDKYNDIIRLNCGRYQLQIKDNDLAGKCRWHAISETDSRTSKIFAVALACSNNGEYYSKYVHLVNTINLDGINENIF